MKKVLFIILVMLGAGIGYTQDPGIPDTVRFGDWGVYLPCPPCSGIATAPIYVFNDEFLVTMQFYLECIGPLRFKDIEFSAGIDSHLSDHQWKYIPDADSDFMSFGATNFYFTDSLPPGLRNIGFLVLTINDTGMALVDTASPEAPPDPPIWFRTPNIVTFIPKIIITTQFQLKVQSIKPGDANADSKVNLGDIIYLVNYIFKNGPEPVNKQLTDVNVDCLVDLRDLLYIVNYVFKGGSPPIPGCAWDEFTQVENRNYKILTKIV